MRTWQSRDFVINTLGIPQNINEIIFDDKNIEKDIYVNEYCSIICYYDQTTLIGFIVIGNSNKFKYIDYRSGAILFETKIVEAGVQADGYLCDVKQMVGERVDCNRYYAEYYQQHFFGDDQIVGYAICDIGFFDKNMGERFSDMPGLYSIREQNEGILGTDIIKREDFKEIRESKFNVFFTVAYAGVDAEKFVDEIILDDCFLGMTKGQYFNIAYNYKDYGEMYEN